MCTTFVTFYKLNGLCSLKWQCMCYTEIPYPRPSKNFDGVQTTCWIIFPMLHTTKSISLQDSVLNLFTIWDQWQKQEQQATNGYSFVASKQHKLGLRATTKISRLNMDSFNTKKKPEKGQDRINNTIKSKFVSPWLSIVNEKAFISKTLELVITHSHHTRHKIWMDTTDI
jgi:hypothetical protein